MKKNILLRLVVSAVVMLGFPYLAVTYVEGDAGMVVCLLLFFAVNPLFFLCIGADAARDIGHLWSVPVSSAALFLVGAWVFFDRGEAAFILYAVAYLALGMAAMLLAIWISRRVKRAGFRP